MDPYLSPVEHRRQEKGKPQVVCLGKECFTTPLAESSSKLQTEGACPPTSQMPHGCLCENARALETKSGLRTQVQGIGTQQVTTGPYGGGKAATVSDWRVFTCVHMEKPPGGSQKCFTG